MHVTRESGSRTFKAFFRLEDKLSLIYTLLEMELGVNGRHAFVGVWLYLDVSGLVRWRLECLIFTESAGESQARGAILFLHSLCQPPTCQTKQGFSSFAVCCGSSSSSSAWVKAVSVLAWVRDATAALPFQKASWMARLTLRNQSAPSLALWPICFGNTFEVPHVNRVSSPTILTTPISD